MGDSYPTFLSRMFKLAMTTFLVAFNPTIPLNYFYYFCTLHILYYTHYTHKTPMQKIKRLQKILISISLERLIIPNLNQKTTAQRLASNEYLNWSPE